MKNIFLRLRPAWKKRDISKRLLELELENRNLKSIIARVPDIYKADSKSFLHSNILNKEVGNALRVNEERFNTFLDNSPAASFIKDLEGRLIYINKTFAKIFEFDDNSWKNKTDFELWQEETAKVLRQHDLEILDSGIPYSVEESINHNNKELDRMSVV
jgi:PAS domain-containing protein